MKNARERASNSGAGMRAVRHVGIGVAAGAFFCALMLVLFAFIFLKMGQIPVAALNPVSIGISAVGAFFAGLIAGKLSKQRGLLYGSIAGLVLFLIFLISSLSVSKEALTWLTATRLAVMVLSGAIGGLLAMNRRKRKVKVK